MNALNPFFKKKQKQIEKKSKKLEKYKFLILKYLDPIQTHRFYGDFISFGNFQIPESTDLN